MTVPQIRNPRRILCVGPPDSGVLDLLKQLTGTTPSPLSIPDTNHTEALTPTTTIESGEHDTATSGSGPAQSNESRPSTPPTTTTTTHPATPPPIPTTTTTTAGTSHILHIRTAYYTADVPIWLDEAANPTTWARDFMTEEAGEVVRAVGAWVVVFRRGVLMMEGDGKEKGEGAEGAVGVGGDDGREGDMGADGRGGTEGEREASTQSGTEQTTITQHTSHPESHTTETEKHPRPPPWRQHHALTLLTSIASIIAHAHSAAAEPWDGVLLAVGMPGGLVSSTSTSTIADEAALADEWEDACFEAGFEYVDCGSAGAGDGSGGNNGVSGRQGSASGSGRGPNGLDEEADQRNEFGEVFGVARVRQALEACEWEDMEMGAQDYDDAGTGSDSRVPDAVEGDIEDDLAWLEDDVDFTSLGAVGAALGGASRMRKRTEAGAALLQSEEAAGSEEVDGEMAFDIRRTFEGRTTKGKSSTATNFDALGQEGEQEASEPESEQDVENLDVLLRKVLAVKEMSGHLSEAERKRMARRLVEEVMGGDGS